MLVNAQQKFSQIKRVNCLNVTVVYCMNSAGWVLLNWGVTKRFSNKVVVNIDYFMGRALVPHFRTSLRCIKNLTRSLRSFVLFLIQTDKCENAIQVPSPWCNLYLLRLCLKFHTYWDFHFFFCCFNLFLFSNELTSHWNKSEHTAFTYKNVALNA